MTINFQNPQMVSDRLADYIRNKVSKLETYYDRIEAANIFIKEDDGHGPTDHVVEIRLAVPGPDLFAEDKSSESIEAAVSSVVEKLRRQIAKHKEKMKSY